jgi:hypothetical protein
MLFKLILVLITASLWCLGYGQELPAIQTQGLPTENILNNPGFESGKYGWTVSSGAVTTETSVVFKGKNSLKIVLNNQTLNAYQDSTKYASQYADGPQGLGYIRVKTSVSGVKFCARKAGVVQTSLCVSSQGSGKWEHLKVPFILGETSNGIVALTESAKTGTVFLDDSFLGTASLTQEMNACNSVSCETEFSAVISGTGVITQESSDWLGTCVRSGTGNRTATCTVNPSLGLTTGMNCTGNVNQAITTVFNAGVVNVVSTSSTNIVFDTAQASDGAGVGIPAYIICQKQGADFTAAKQLSNGSTYSSTNADTDWASCTPTSSQGFGTPTFAVQCKRQGGDLLMKGRFTPSGTTAVEARLGLPLWNGVQLVSADSSIIPALEVANGFYIRAVTSTAHGGGVLVEPSVPYITFGPADTFNTVSTIPLSKANGNAIASTDTLSFNARIPIAGWQQSNLTIAELSGLQSCSSTLECTDTFSAKVSAAGVVSAENVDWINGNASIAGTSQYTLTFKTGIFSVSPTCTITNKDTNHFGVDNVSESSSLLSYGTVNTGNGVNNVAAVNIICQKQGADYIGKTAKAVASDQNLRTPGLTNGIVLSASVGSSSASVCSASPCAYVDQTGGYISSVTRSSLGNYVMNFNKTFERLKCTHSQWGGAVAGNVLGNICNNCNSIVLAGRNNSGAAQDAAWDTICTGY